MSRPSQVIVVLEDDHHKMLLYRYLKRSRLETVTTIKRSPKGEGSAEGWVRNTFVKEVAAYRSRQAETALIVVIDADASTVRDRITQLDQALKDGGKQTVAADERIARLVPKRNVETWILCLNDEAVDEQPDYKRTRKDWNDLIPPAAQALFEWTRRGAELPNHCIDSLGHGVRELNRLAALWR